MITVIKSIPVGFHLDTDEVFELQAKVEPARNEIDEEEPLGDIIHSVWNRCERWREGQRGRSFYISYAQIRYLQSACDQLGHPFRMFGVIMEREIQHDGTFDTYRTGSDEA